MNTFDNCTSLVNGPVIPNNVTNMDSTFRNCTNLVSVPAIPDSVIYLDNTFYGCSSLKNVNFVINNVLYMNKTFFDCTSLTGSITINSEPFSYYLCFKGVNLTNVTISGTSSILDEIIASAN